MLADVSQSIPETGGGISGFVAHGLWYIYRHFPSSGQYDYLLLFVLLMVLARVAFVPYVLKTLKRDIARARKGTLKEGSAVFHLLLSMLWDTVSISVLVWFFHTNAGKTFLVGRTCFGQELTEPARGLGGISLVSWFCVVLLAWGVLDIAETVWEKETPNPTVTLYIGGAALLGFVSGMILAAHVLYWYWSRATILLFWSYFVAVVLTEIIRIIAVYILLRRPENSVGPD